MAETFFCNDEMVHWTNGGCKEIFHGWSLCANYLKYSDLELVFEEYLNYGAGCKATGIDSEFLDARLDESKLKTQWLGVMDMLIQDIRMSGNIATKLDINWDHELIEEWCSKLSKMRNALKNQIID